MYKQDAIYNLNSAYFFYFRATIARNEKTFWENVTSQVIVASGDDPKEACGAEKTMFTFALLFASYLTTKLVS